MSKQYKFRGYDKVNKRMFEVYGLGVDWCTENTFDGVNERQNYWADKDFFDRIEIMPFLGKVGLNKLDLYLGDIVLVKASKKKGAYLAKIIEKNQGVTFYPNNTYYKDDTCFISIVSIVGNIYENPNLLSS